MLRIELNTIYLQFNGPRKTELMLKKLKGLFFVEDESSKTTSTKGKAETKKAAKPKDSAPIESSAELSSTTPSNPNVAPSKKFIEVLLRAIESNNLEGFDYLEFKSSLQSLSKMEMDEQTRYQSAMAMAKTMGASKTSLLSSGNHYLKILKGEQTKFMQAHQSQKTKQVADRENKVKQLENLIKEKNQKIAALQKEIEKDQKSLEAEKANINRSAAKVAATKDGFLAAYAKVSQQIQNDLDKMKQFIK